MTPSPEIAARVAAMRPMAERAWQNGEFFFYVRIPESLRPEGRAEKYELPLQTDFHRLRLGRVTGGGQQLGEGGAIEYCGIDVVLSERVRGLDALRSILIALGAPQSTIIEEHFPQFQEHALNA